MLSAIPFEDYTLAIEAQDAFHTYSFIPVENEAHFLIILHVLDSIGKKRG